MGGKGFVILLVFVLSLSMVYGNSFIYGAEGGDYYSYAPSIIDDGLSKKYWTCHNFESGTIVDNIGYFKEGTALGDSVLSPGTSGGWDDYHVCDPSIVYGPFLYNGEWYDYAMFYLGYQSSDVGNEVGIAFSHDLINGGTWIKSDQNPIIPYIDPVPGNVWWGVGQPSVLNIDGTIWIFYTVGDSYGTRTVYQTMDPGDYTSLTERKPVITAGIDKIDGSSGILNNADFAYDPINDLFIGVRDKHTSNENFGGETNPVYITKAVEIISIPRAEIETGTWTVHGEINGTKSGYDRNHNAGISRDEKGHLLDSNAVPISYTVSCADGGDNPCTSIPEWSYDIYETTFYVDNSLTCELPNGTTIDNGESATLYETASVPSGSTCTSETRTCTDGTLSGTFTFDTCEVLPEESYELSVSLTGQGSVTSTPSGINCGSTCSSDYATNTIVELTASASNGYVFSEWTGACSGTGSCSITLDQANTVEAVFVEESLCTGSLPSSGNYVNGSSTYTGTNDPSSWTHVSSTPSTCEFSCNSGYSYNTTSEECEVIESSGTISGIFYLTASYDGNQIAQSQSREVEFVVTSENVDGVCGSANNSNYDTAPTSDLCSSGTANETGSWSWTCEGSAGGSDASCFANENIDGVCSSILNTCDSGILNDIDDNSTHYKWECEGEYGGDTDSCSVAMTCSDGIQNQGETGVDCGGPNCGACGEWLYVADIIGARALFDEPHCRDTCQSIGKVASANADGFECKSDNYPSGAYLINWDGNRVGPTGAAGHCSYGRTNANEFLEYCYCS